jgi:hypothetical protein
VYLADMSSVTVRTWHERTGSVIEQPVSLKYIKPLVDGIGYYEKFGYYNVDKVRRVSAFHPAIRCPTNGAVVACAGLVLHLSAS